MSGNVSYGLVPQEHWLEPAWIDQERAAESRKKMKEAKVIYGGNEAYRRMCRYQSGFFFRHELLQQYDWYWRVVRTSDALFAVVQAQRKRKHRSRS